MPRVPAASGRFNADGSIRLPEAGSANGTETAANPIEAGKARWAEMQVRGENPLDCQRSRFAAAYAPDESLGDKVSRKYLKWIGLADPAGIAERAAAKQTRGGWLRVILTSGRKQQTVTRWKPARAMQ